ncbi:MAG: DUF4129 domain-containing protein [Coriobacteriia bacterium]|nr:DUF4129 domain-containing protein [Coriobacteriia bacterium]
MRKMRFFLRSAVPDFLLVLVSSVCLSLAVSYGFDAAAGLRGNVLIHAGIAIPLLVILFAGGWSKKAVAASAFGVCVYCAAVIVVCALSVPADVPLFVDAQINDVDGNYVVFGFVLVVVPVLTYLLSRRRVGVLVLLVGGVLTFGLTQYLFRAWATEEPGTVIALVGMIALFALFVFQGYRSNVVQSSRVRKTAFAPAAAFAVVVSALCLGVGALAFVLVIGNLGLTTPEIKPFQDYYARPVVEYSGVYDEQQVDNPDLTTSQTNDTVLDSNQDAEDGQHDQSPQDNQNQGADPLTQTFQFLSAFDPSDWNAAFAAINYQQLALSALAIAALIVLALAILVLIWDQRRKRRLQKWAQEPVQTRIYHMYDYFVDRFAKMGLRRPENMTLLEYALASRQNMAPFAQGTRGVDFLALTLAYQRACYAAGSATEADGTLFESFYQAFYKNARTYVGKRKWLFLYWRM